MTPNLRRGRRPRRGRARATHGAWPGSRRHADAPRPGPVRSPSQLVEPRRGSGRIAGLAAPPGRVGPRRPAPGVVRVQDPQQRPPDVGQFGVRPRRITGPAPVGGGLPRRGDRDRVGRLPVRGPGRRPPPPGRRPPAPQCQPLRAVAPAGPPSVIVSGSRGPAPGGARAAARREAAAPLGITAHALPVGGVVTGALGAAVVMAESPLRSRPARARSRPPPSTSPASPRQYAASARARSTAG